MEKIFCKKQNSLKLVLSLDMAETLCMIEFSGGGGVSNGLNSCFLPYMGCCTSRNICVFCCAHKQANQKNKYCSKVDKKVIAYIAEFVQSKILFALQCVFGESFHRLTFRWQ